MNRLAIVAMIGLFGHLACSQPAFAEIIWVKSKIAEINTTSGYFKLYYLDPQTQKTEEIKVDLGASTLFEGVESLRDLKKGDEVSVQTNFDAFTHKWTALEIKFTAPADSP